MFSISHQITAQVGTRVETLLEFRLSFCEPTFHNTKAPCASRQVPRLRSHNTPEHYRQSLRLAMSWGPALDFQCRFEVSNLDGINQNTRYPTNFFRGPFRW